MAVGLAQECVKTIPWDPGYLQSQCGHGKTRCVRVIRGPRGHSGAFNEWIQTMIGPDEAVIEDGPVLWDTPSSSHFEYASGFFSVPDTGVYQISFYLSTADEMNVLLQSVALGNIIEIAQGVACAVIVQLSAGDQLSLVTTRASNTVSPASGGSDGAAGYMSINRID